VSEVATPAVEWVKAFAPIIAAAIVVLGGAAITFWLNTKLETFKAGQSHVSRLKGAADEKRGQVAAQLLLAVTRTVEAAKRACPQSLVTMAKVVAQAYDDQRLLGDRIERWQPVRLAQVQLLEAAEQAQIFLTDPAVDLLVERIQDQVLELDLGQWRYETMLKEKESEDLGDPIAPEEVYGVNAHRKLDRLRADARAHLIPIAQLASGATPKGGA
jgi:hypothetical protein